MLNKKMGQKISALRKEANLSQTELGKKIGYQQADISRIEKGNKDLTFSALVEVAQLFNVSTDYLLGLLDYQLVDVNKKMQVDIMTERLRIVIDQSKLTREKIAIEIGMDTSTVTKYYTGDRKLTVDAIKKFAILFNVSTDYLLGISEAKTNNKDLQFICDYIGLEPDTITILNKMLMQKNNKSLNFINNFIGDFSKMNF